MLDNYIGEIKAFPYTYVPEGWIACQGQSLPVGQYQALAAVIGYTYGGNPSQGTFKLPDLRGVVPMGATGSNSNPNSINVAQTGGTEGVTLTTSQMPAHNHNLQGIAVVQTNNVANITNQPGPTTYLTNPVYTTPATPAPKVTTAFAYDNAGAGVQLNPSALVPQGGNGIHENRMPFLPMQLAICYNGTFPVHQS